MKKIFFYLTLTLMPYMKCMIRQREDSSQAESHLKEISLEASRTRDRAEESGEGIRRRERDRRHSSKKTINYCNCCKYPKERIESGQDQIMTIKGELHWLMYLCKQNVSAIIANIGLPGDTEATLSAIKESFINNYEESDVEAMKVLYDKCKRWSRLLGARNDAHTQSDIDWLHEQIHLWQDNHH